VAIKLGFEEEQTPYESPSQSARAWTERWVSDWGFCPNCGNSKMTQYERNRPVADFFCSSCNEDYELKSKKGKFGARILDGAYGSMCERLTASNNPNLMLMNYNLDLLSVVNLFVVPKHFFVREIIEERKPLGRNARRAGWIGCNIRLDQVPSSGRVFLVQAGQVVPKESVLSQWRRTLFLRGENLDARGWLIEVMKCVDAVGKTEFELEDVYRFEGRLRSIYPNNNNIRPKIRQQLQVLRDYGYLDFVGRGQYRLRSTPQ
jgi:type II restriction enzyme